LPAHNQTCGIQTRNMKENEPNLIELFSRKDEKTARPK